MGRLERDVKEENSKDKSSIIIFGAYAVGGTEGLMMRLSVIHQDPENNFEFFYHGIKSKIKIKRRKCWERSLFSKHKQLNVLSQ